MRFFYLDRSRPEIPGDTCPVLNEVQEGVARIIKVLEETASETEDETASCAMLDAARELNELTHDHGQYSWTKSPLEKARHANEQLREVGKYWRGQAKELCSALDDIEQAGEGT